MSKLYIEDLERIKNGKIKRYSIGASSKSNSLVSLKRIDSERHELRSIRENIIEEFKSDVKNRFNDIMGNKKINELNVSLNPEKIFLKDYLSLVVPTILGDTYCLLDKNGLVSSSSISEDLCYKIEIMLPYIRKILDINKKTNILKNEFFDDINIYNDSNDKVLVLNGGGVFLPFDNYQDISEQDLQDLLMYYYSNLNDILKNILIPNTEELNRFRSDIKFDEAKTLYKGIK